MLFEDKSKEHVYRVLGDFASYLNTMAVKHRLISASTASAFVYYVREDSYAHTVTLDSFYLKLKSMMEILYKIKKENRSIETTDFWNSILKVKGLLENKDSFSHSDMESILEYFGSAILKNISLELSDESDITSTHKGFVQIGRSSKAEHANDIVFKDDRTLSRIHLVVTVEKNEFLIEDRSANGTFVNGLKIQKGVKHPVTYNDEIRIGREGTLVDLNHPKIQELL